MLETRLKEIFEQLLPFTKKKFPKILTDLLKRANEVDKGEFGEDESYEKTEQLMKDVNRVLDLDRNLRKIL